MPPVRARRERGERRLATDAEARALASALRIRILRVCLREAHTNKEIAAAVGRDPASTLHHVRRLVETGFLAAQPERRGARGAREIPYLATGKSWKVSTPANGRTLVDAFLDEIATVPASELDTARLGLRVSAERLREFTDRVAEVFAEFAELPDDPDAAPMSVFFAVHPDTTRPRKN